MKKKLAVGSLILASALLLSACSYKTSSTNQGQGQSSSSPTVSEAVMITYSDQGFSLAEAKAKAGQQIGFKNTSSDSVQVNSDVHPTHLLYPELNIGFINPGETKSVTFAKAGTYTFHNHLNPSQKGTITVE